MASQLRVMACVFCKAAMFREWVAEQTGAGCSEADAKKYILDKCGVKSRTELDTPTAAPRFHDLVRKPYLKWKESA